MRKSKSKTPEQRGGRGRLLASLAIPLALVGQGCASWDTDANRVPANVQKFAREVPRVENSSQSPCWQQRQIAKNTAFLDSAAQGGKEVIYKIAPKCKELEPQSR